VKWSDRKKFFGGKNKKTEDLKENENFFLMIFSLKFLPRKI